MFKLTNAGYNLNWTEHMETNKMSHWCIRKVCRTEWKSARRFPGDKDGLPSLCGVTDLHFPSGLTSPPPPTQAHTHLRTHASRATGQMSSKEGGGGCIHMCMWWNLTRGQILFSWSTLNVLIHFTDSSEYEYMLWTSLLKLQRTVGGLSPTGAAGDNGNTYSPGAVKWNLTDEKPSGCWASVRVLTLSWFCFLMMTNGLASDRSLSSVYWGCWGRGSCMIIMWYLPLI